MHRRSPPSASDPGSMSPSMAGMAMGRYQKPWPSSTSSSNAGSIPWSRRAYLRRGHVHEGGGQPGQDVGRCVGMAGHVLAQQRVAIARQSGKRVSRSVWMLDDLSAHVVVGVLGQQGQFVVRCVGVWDEGQAYVTVGVLRETGECVARRAGVPGHGFAHLGRGIPGKLHEATRRRVRIARFQQRRCQRRRREARKHNGGARCRQAGERYGDRPPTQFDARHAAAHCLVVSPRPPPGETQPPRQRTVRFAVQHGAAAQRHLRCQRPRCSISAADTGPPVPCHGKSAQRGGGTFSGSRAFLFRGTHVASSSTARTHVRGGQPLCRLAATG